MSYTIIAEDNVLLVGTPLSKIDEQPQVSRYTTPTTRSFLGSFESADDVATASRLPGTKPTGKLDPQPYNRAGETIRGDRPPAATECGERRPTRESLRWRLPFQRPRLNALTDAHGNHIRVAAALSTITAPLTCCKPPLSPR